MINAITLIVQRYLFADIDKRFADADDPLQIIHVTLASIRRRTVAQFRGGRTQPSCPRGR